MSWTFNSIICAALCSNIACQIGQRRLLPVQKRSLMRTGRVLVPGSNNVILRWPCGDLARHKRSISIKCRIWERLSTFYTDVSAAFASRSASQGFTKSLGYGTAQFQEKSQSTKFFFQKRSIVVVSIWLYCRKKTLVMWSRARSRVKGFWLPLALLH